MKVVVTKQEFPYDVGIWRNLRAGMGGGWNVSFYSTLEERERDFAFLFLQLGDVGCLHLANGSSGIYLDTAMVLAVCSYASAGVRSSV